MIVDNIIVSGEAILNAENGGNPLGAHSARSLADGEGACCPQ